MNRPLKAEARGHGDADNITPRAPATVEAAPAEEHPAPVEARSRRRTIDPDKLIPGQEAP
jgi:hypothetical protein